MKVLKIIMFFVIVYVLSVFTAYFSMIDYEDTVSSSCLECSLVRDVFLLSVFSSIVLAFLFFVFKKVLKKRMFISIVIVLLFITFSFLNNYYIFIDRVSAWSSFSLKGEILGVISDSYLYLIISAVILFVVLMRLNTVNTNTVSKSESTQFHE